jgi:serine/threonine-protein kinase
MARRAAQKALELNPHLPEAHLAMGRYYYRGFLDYDRALDHYQQALQRNPNSSDLLFAIGSVKRRQGQWAGAVDFFQQAVLLDPRAATKLRNLSETYLYMRQFDSGLVTAQKIIDLAPDDPSAYALKSRIMGYGLGKFDSAAAILDRFHLSGNLEVTDVLINLYVLSGKLDSSLELLEVARQTDYFTSDSSYWYLQCGEINRWLGRRKQSQAAYDSARVILETDVKERPDEAAYRSMLGTAYAGLGRDLEAVQEGRSATELSPVSRDAVSGMSWRFNLLLIYTMLGKDDLAIEEIKYLMSVPSPLTAVYLNDHPVFSKIRKTFDFQKLLEHT